MIVWRIDEVPLSKYFIFSLDISLMINHSEQLTIIIRYIIRIKSIEIFLTFFDNECHVV